MLSDINKMTLNEAIEPHYELNPLIWDSNSELLPDVKEKLLEIVEYFKESIDIPLEIADIHLVGSNASYNYTDGSDLDVHVVVNFSLMDASKEILQVAFNKERKEFNDTYDITVHGINVEMYVEDINASTMSNGIYSLMRGKWLKFPKPLEVVDIDFSDVLSKWEDRVKFAIESGDSGEIKNLINIAYMMRKNSLQSDGELGAGNLLFKELRKNGILSELRSALVSIDSSRLSLESLTESLMLEDSRQKLINKNKQSMKGKERFKRRVKSKVASQVRQFNSIDMDKLFREGILTVNVAVKGETSDYTVRISFGSFTEMLQKEVERDGSFELRTVTKTLINGFNKDDVYIHCSCPDWKYRFAYWATRNDINSGEPQNSNGKQIRNPDDRLGSGCKHVMLVLSNNSWLIKVASVIRNYVKYMEKHYEKQYADIIYPAIYGKEYEEPVQLGIDIDDDNTLVSDETTLDVANELGRTSTQFKKGNEQGYRFVKKGDGEQIDGQQSIEDML